jgi:YfiH family protein
MAADHIDLELPGACVRFTTRAGGVSTGPFQSLNLGLLTDDDPEAVAENRRRVAEADALAWGRQVHGTRVLTVGGATTPGTAPDADGVVTAARGVRTLALTADCLPVALVAPEAVAMVHAGWRGLAGGVLAEGADALRALGASRIAAAIGPGAGPCCYEVGPEVHAAFGTSGRTIDLKALARERLEAAGVAEVHDCGLCTICDPERFFSHRRDDGVTGRQAGIAWRS